MAVTLAKFRNAFDEFRSTDDGAIEAKLVLARLEVNAGVWGGRADSGVMHMTAHLLSLAPSGQNARLKVTGRTPYLMQYNRMKRAVTSGFARTAGMAPPGAFNEPINNTR